MHSCLWYQVYLILIACGNKDVLFLVEKKVLLPVKKDGTIACGELYVIACGMKDVLFPVERGVPNCLWREKSTQSVMEWKIE